MIIKLRQQLETHKRTMNNQTPSLRSREFILNFLRRKRLQKTSPSLKSGLGLARWLIIKTKPATSIIIQRSECFITGRSRGTSQRYTVARTKIKELASEAKLFGTRKAS